MNPFHKDYYYQVSHMRLILSEIRIQIYIPGVSDTASEQVTVCFNNVLPQRSRPAKYNNFAQHKASSPRVTNNRHNAIFVCALIKQARLMPASTITMLLTSVK